ncbi:MAG: transporter substrate-binding domain-containing protein [Chloroflexota bacterium]|nr:transporter substrate-binding domain-containing protein [Chloroflexota bacterium]
MTFKPRALLVVVTIVALLLTVFGVSAQDLPDLGGQTITVAVENAYIPFNFIDETTGEAAGWDYDAIGEICVRVNCVPEYIQTSWDTMLVAISNGEFDVAADGITITEERDQSVDFSMGYIAIDQVLLTRLDETRFDDIDGFVTDESLRMGTQLGTTNYNTAVELIGDARIQSYDTFGFAVEALVAGDVDAVIIDSTAGQGYVGANAERVKIIGGSIQSDYLGFAFPEGSELVAAFDAALQSMIDDGTLEQINAKWFAPVTSTVILPDLGGQTITVAVENAYIPFNFIDETTGEPAGWDYDAIGEICIRLNCVPEYIQSSWDTMLVAISNGEFDVAADGITITEERDQSVDFSMGYIAVEQILLIRIEEDRFDSIDAFVADSTLRIGTQLGTTNYNTAVGLIGEGRLQSYDTFGFAIEALVAGDVDAVIIDSTSGQGYVGANAGRVKIIGGSIQSDYLGFAFPEGSELVAAFDAALQSMIDDGTLEQINAEWFPPAEAAAE